MHPTKGCIRLLLFSVCLKLVVSVLRNADEALYLYFICLLSYSYMFSFSLWFISQDIAKKKVRTSAHPVRLRYDQAPANNKKSQRNTPLYGMYSLCFFSVCTKFGRFQPRDSTCKYTIFKFLLGMSKDTS